MEEMIKRIEQMEAIFDHLLLTEKTDPEKFRTDPETIRMMDTLLRYYEGGVWLKDYEADEKGLLPKDLKRGVLSEDGVYNLIAELDKE